MSALSWYPVSTVSPYSHARYALAEALRRSLIRPGATVLVPEFICRDVLASLHAVEARPTYYAVDADLRPIGLLDHPPAHAALAVDYFGIPQDMEPFLELRNRDGTVIIEDNAHGLLGRDPNGRLLGTRGDFGLLSMRKTFHLPDGAALLDNRPDAPIGSWDCASGRRGALRRRVAQLDRTTGLPLMSSARAIVRLARRSIGRPALPTADGDETQLPGDPMISCSALRALSQLSPEHEAERRRRLLIDVTTAIDTMSGIEPLAHRFGPLAVPYGLPFRATVDGATAVGRRVRRYHVTVMPWPDLPRAIAPNAPGHYCDVWLANFI